GRRRSRNATVGWSRLQRATPWTPALASSISASGWSMRQATTSTSRTSVWSSMTAIFIGTGLSLRLDGNVRIDVAHAFRVEGERDRPPDQVGGRRGAREDHVAVLRLDADVPGREVPVEDVLGLDDRDDAGVGDPLAGDLRLLTDDLAGLREV